MNKMPYPGINSKEAYSRIRDKISLTPLIYDSLSGIYWKCENQQTTGSFKFRGALAKLSLLPRSSSIITASTGNHALGILEASKFFDHQVEIFLPESASDAKRKKLVDKNANLHFVKGNSLDAEISAKRFAQEKSLIWVSPYNDIDIISGQGTIGVELMEQLEGIENVYITVGGGGLISGIGIYLKSMNPIVRIVGCQPQNSREMFLSLKAGEVVEDPYASDTLSDGSAGPLEKDSITFAICQEIIDDMIVVNEDEISNSIKRAYDQFGQTIEGAAGVAIAASEKDQNKGTGKSVVILCGGNIDPLKHSEIVTG